MLHQSSSALTAWSRFHVRTFCTTGISELQCKFRAEFALKVALALIVGRDFLNLCPCLALLLFLQLVVDALMARVTSANSGKHFSDDGFVGRSAHVLITLTRNPDFQSKPLSANS